MEFQLSYFKSWKMMLWKCCTQYVNKFGKLSSSHRTGKGRFTFQYQRMLKLLHNVHISHASKVIFKIVQAKLQQDVNQELADVQAGFRKGWGTRDQVVNIRWIIKKAREFRKTTLFALLTMPKPLTVWITTNCGKFFMRWKCQTTLPVFWEIWMQVKKQ